MPKKVVASIVTYNNSIPRLIETANSFLKVNLDNLLVIVDNNSPNDTLEKLKPHFKADFIQAGANNGFGAGHNIAIKKYLDSEYFLVLNPDVTIHENSLEKMINFMEENPEVGLLGPKILNPDKSIQYLCKTDPSFFHLFARRFLPSFIKKIPAMKRLMDSYEMKETGYSQLMTVPYMSGCFMLFRTSIFKKIGFFDENIFMYLEDADITRRVNEVSKAIFYPEATITHDWARGSHRNWFLTWITIKSSFYYFRKWGWKLI